MKIGSYKNNLEKVKARYFKIYFSRNDNQNLRLDLASKLAENPRRKKIEEGNKNPLTLAKFKDQEKLIARALEKGGVVCPVCDEKVPMRMLKGKKTWVDTISGTMHLRCYKKTKRYYQKTIESEEKND